MQSTFIANATLLALDRRGFGKSQKSMLWKAASQPRSKPSTFWIWVWQKDSPDIYAGLCVFSSLTLAAHKSSHLHPHNTQRCQYIH
jgi:hypothetical protein